MIAVMMTCLVTSAWTQEKFSIETVKGNYRKRILETMKKDHIVGVSLIVLDKDSIVWEESFGFSDKEKSVKVDVNTMFGIGSVTKVFTAVAALKAQEQQLWNIDNPLNQYLPFRPKGSNASNVTLRSMLYHHSGLPSDIFAGMFSEKAGDYSTVLNSLNDEYLATEPGLIRSYSNPAFSLMGLGIENVSGLSYPEYVKRNLLTPLKMNRTHFDCRNVELSKTYNRDGEEATDACLRDVPAGGMYTTASDMGRWAKALLLEDTLILKHESFRDMFSIQNKNVPLDLGDSYGLSWSRSEKPFVGAYWSHTGTTLYYNASLVIAKEAGLAIAILTNSQNGDNIYTLGSSILRDVAKAKGLKAKDIQKTNLGNKKKIRIVRATLENYEGTYVQPGLILPIRLKGNNLVTRITGIKVSLIPVAEQAFVPKAWLLGIIPIRLNDTRFYFESVNGYSLLTQRDGSGSNEMLGVKVNPQSNQDWDKLKGKYITANPISHEVELMKSLEVKEQNNLIVLSLRMHGVKREMIMPLDIQTTSLAKVAGLGRYAGTTVEVVESDTKETIIKAFGVKLKKVK